MDMVMSQIAGILDHHVDFNPAGDFEEFLRLVPAKWVVYLFADEADQPLQLLCVKNLRSSLKRRLQGERISLTKSVDYREIVRRIFGRDVLRLCPRSLTVAALIGLAGQYPVIGWVRSSRAANAP